MFKHHQVAKIWGLENYRCALKIHFQRYKVYVQQLVSITPFSRINPLNAKVTHKGWDFRYDLS